MTMEIKIDGELIDNRVVGILLETIGDYSDEMIIPNELVQDLFKVINYFDKYDVGCQYIRKDKIVKVTLNTYD